MSRGGRGRGRFRGRGRIPNLKLDYDDEDVKRGATASTDIQPPENYPVLRKPWAPLLLLKDEKDLVEKMRYLDEYYRSSGYYLSTKKKQYAGVKRYAEFLQASERKWNLLDEIPKLSTTLFPDELLVGMKRRKKGIDLNRAQSVGSGFLSSEFLENIEDLVDNGDEDELEQDEFGEAPEEDEDDGGDYDIGAHLDNDEDNVNAFGNDDGAVM